MNMPIKNKPLYRPEIDGLRAFAIIAVIIYHFNKDILPSGFLGVDIFFVISGYVISSSFSKIKSESISTFLINFYTKRIKRLLPALIFFIITFCLILVTLIPQTGSYLKTAIAALFGLSNLYLFNYSTDYFAQQNELNVFLHTWSLGVEEQFYFIFPFIVWFTGFNKKIKNGSRNILITILFLSTLSLLSFIFTYKINEPAAYFLTHNRFWEIAIGSLTFLIVNNRSKLKNLIQKIPNFLLILGLIVILFAENISPIIKHSIAVALTSFLLIGLIKKDFIYKLLIQEKFRYIGKISYSLYLWHWGIISISRWTIGIHWWSIPIQLFLIYLISDFSYRFIENPFREKNFFKYNMLNILVGFLTALSSATFLYLLGGPLKGIIYIGSNENIENFSEKEFWDFKNCESKNFESKEILLKKYQRCWVSQNGYLDYKSDNKSIFIYGNSYNAMLMPIAAEISISGEKINFHSSYRVGCLPSLALNYKKDGIMGSCSKTFQSYLNFFNKNSKKGDSLIIIDSYTLFMESPGTKLFYKGKEVNPIKAQEVFFNELVALSKKLNLENKNLIITSPIPAIRNNHLICISKLAKTNNKCKVSEDISIYNIRFNNQMYTINQKMKGIEEYKINYLNIYAVLKELINKDLINNDLNNIYSYYSDTHHLSRKGALKLTNYFKLNILN